MRDRSREVLPLREGCEPRCRGCAHRQWTGAASLEQKAQFVRDRLAPWAAEIGRISSLDGEARWGYRDKVTLRAGYREGVWRFGLMLRDELLPIERCPVQSPRIAGLLQAFSAALPPPSAFPLAFWAQSGALLTLVVKTHAEVPLAWVDAVAPALRAGGMAGLWLHRNPSAGRRLYMRSGWALLWGEARARDVHGLVHGRAAFQQLVPALHAASLDEAEAFLEPRGGDGVVDLYCGVGASLRRWLARGARAVGVELAGEAIECAGLNAPGATLLRGTCGTRLPQLETFAANTEGRRLLYANPPRTGLEPDVLSWVAERFRPARVAYLSCSPGTLRRDLEALAAAGYRIRRLSPYDFFPQTHHVETLALLER